MLVFLVTASLTEVDWSVRATLQTSVDQKEFSLLCFGEIASLNRGGPLPQVVIGRSRNVQGLLRNVGAFAPSVWRTLSSKA